MRACQGRDGRRVKTLFVSDVHLGCRHAHAREFLNLLNCFEPERLYVVGDFIDGWKLRHSLKWTSLFNEILERLYRLTQRGTELYYTPGNHDGFLRSFAWNFDFVQLSDEFIFRSVDGRRFLVTHGDHFDTVEQSAKWVSMLASVGYDGLLSANRAVAGLFGLKARGASSFSAGVKRSVKRLVRYISDFECRLVKHARMNCCDGVICGHIHTPIMANYQGVDYFNTGDWVENCTALVEYTTGEFELLYYFDDTSRYEPRARNASRTSGFSAVNNLAATFTDEPSIVPVLVPSAATAPSLVP